MELPFAGVDEPAKSIGINEGIGPSAGFQPCAFFFQMKKSAVRAEKDVAAQLLEPREGMLIVGDNVGIRPVVNQPVT